MKDVAAGGGVYQDFALDEEALPSNVSAGGLRPGGITMMCMGMPKDKAATISGHKIPSQLETYIHANLSDMAPGVCVLSGFSPPPWGTNGPMPLAMSLESLGGDDDGRDPAKLQAYCVQVLRLEESSPYLQPGGPLWPATKASMAALLMYYPERHEHNELPALRVKMRSAFMKIYRTGFVSQAEHGIAHRRLLAWSKLIKTAWKLANVALLPLARGAAPAAAPLRPLVEAVQALDDRFEQRDDQHKVVMGRLSEVQESLADLGNRLVRLALDGGGCGGDDDEDEMREGADAPGSALPQSPSRVGSSHALASPAARSANAKAFFSGLMMQQEGSANNYELKGKTAEEVFADCMSEYGGHAPARMKGANKRRVSLVNAHFGAMATLDERNMLSGKADTQKKAKSTSTTFTKTRKLVSDINQLVCARLAEAFRELEDVKMPNSLKRTMRGGRFPALKAGGIESRLAALTKAGGRKPDPDTYEEWRLKYEADEAASSVAAAGGAAPAKKKRKRAQ